MRVSTLYPVCFLAAISIFAPYAFPQAQQQPTFGSLERGRAVQMLETISADVKKHYYDPKFHGVDWDARIAEAKERIEKSTSQNAALSHIAGALDALNDSHTFFLPPSRPYVHDYGLEFEMIGDHCFITRVRPGSDAEAKGLRAGDEVLTINGYAPGRQNLWQMDYVFHTLRPVLSFRLEVRKPDGSTRQVEASAKFRELSRVLDLMDNIWDMYRQREDSRHLMRAQWVEPSSDLMILKLPIFYYTESEIDGFMSRARKHSSLIIDLRENPGGAVDTLKYLVEDVFPDGVKIPQRTSRKNTKPIFEKFHTHNAFTGKVVVLVDSGSASCSELFARLIQLEKRGTVIGDLSAGAVMEAEHYGYQAGMGITVFYGASITEADVIMGDGKSLEHAGVVPDDLLLPTGQDMAGGKDPVLAHAAQTLGVSLSPEDAGKMFPYEWPTVR